MTTVRDEQSLSRLEVLVLARLSHAKPPSEAELGKDVAKLIEPAERGAQALETTGSTLTSLRRRGLVNARNLTETGKRALRSTFKVEHTPTWSEVRTAHLAALGLGLQPGSADASKTLTSRESLLAHLVCAHLGIAKAPTLNAICDALIMQALDIPHGPLTLERIRAYALARKSPDPVDDQSKGSPAQVAANIGRRVLGDAPGDKRAMVRTLSRRWIYEVSPGARVLSASPRAPDPQPSLPLQPAASPPHPPKGPVVTSADRLLHLVREAIPQIGSDGRFGKEKVFVSALWQRIERDNRLPDLSLDRFKRWLLTANREQLLDLARADLVGAMDPKLVKESEIEDLGATFHFVVDRRPNGTGQGHHAR